MQNNLRHSADSLKNIIPNIAPPDAPVPVHTAYAIPIGSSFIDNERKRKLRANAIISIDKDIKVRVW